MTGIDTYGPLAEIEEVRHRRLLANETNNTQTYANGDGTQYTVIRVHKPKPGTGGLK